MSLVTVWIEWAESAQSDLVDILAYFVSVQEMETGQRILKQLFTATDRLKTFPLSGRPGRIHGTRELVLHSLPYLLVYEFTDEAVRIVSVIHTSKLFPDSLLGGE